MLPISIIILTKNEEKNIERTLVPLTGLTDDIIVIDSGSTDNTTAIARHKGARVIEMEWQGYSKTKNAAHGFSRYDWILSLDADEEINEELKISLQELFSKPVSGHNAFLIKRKMVYCGTVLNHGALANEYRLRLFNRKNARWNENPVHEDIEFNTTVSIKKLDGYMWHHSYNTVKEHEQKIELYAQLFARQKIKEGIRPSVFKTLFSPLFGFIKNYFFRRGFLDGKEGLEYAKTEMKYTSRKYKLIQEANY